MRYAGLSAHDVTHMCVTHFHGDHCLGIPGIIQRMSRDQVTHPVPTAFPASGEQFWQHLRNATAFADDSPTLGYPLHGEEPVVFTGDTFTVTAGKLQHRIDTYGYRLAEPDGWRMLPQRLAERGVFGPAIGRLRSQGVVHNDAGERVELTECAVPRRGHVFAFVMDTAPCYQAVRLARGADLLVVESTYLEREVELASTYRHLTARQAGQIAAEARVGTMVLTHISERYESGDDARFLAEAGEVFSGDIVLACDLERIPVPRRREG